jgi:hypothetical protein
MIGRYPAFVTGRNMFQFGVVVLFKQKPPKHRERLNDTPTGIRWLDDPGRQTVRMQKACILRPVSEEEERRAEQG